MRLSSTRFRSLVVALVVSQGTLFAAIQGSGQQTLSLDDISKRALSVIVSLTGADTEGQAIAPASGFLVRPGLIVTDYRVIKNALKIRVKSAGEEPLDAVLVAVDERFTVATLRIASGPARPDGHKRSLRLRFPFEYIRDAAAGEDAYVFSNFAGGDGSLVSSRVDELRDVAGTRYLHLTGALSPESAGGPVLNAQGHLIGMLVTTPDEGAGPCFAITAGTIGGCGLDGLAATSVAARSEVGAQERVREPGGVPGGLPREPGEARGTEPRDGPNLEMVRKAGGVLQGSAIRRAQPLYPPLAKAARVSGSVVVEVIVDQSGDVISARAVSGHPLMKDCSVAAARGWKFKPTELSGTRIKVIGTVTFNFTLEGGQ